MMNATAIDLDDDEHERLVILRERTPTRTPIAAAIRELGAKLGVGFFSKERDIATVSQTDGDLILAHAGPVIAVDSMGERYDLEVVHDRRGKYLRLDREVLEGRLQALRVMLMPREVTADELRESIATHVNRLNLAQLEDLAAKLGCRP